MAKGCKPKLSKKELYIYISVFLLFFLFVTVVYDIINYAVTETTEYTTQPLSVAVWSLHIVALYLAILGHIYVTQKGIVGKLPRYAVCSIVANLLLYTVRFIVDIIFLNYRPEHYSIFSE